MGFIQEMADLIRKLKFYQIVYEYQQGLYLRRRYSQREALKELG